MPRVNLEKACHINAWEIHGSPTYRAAGSTIQIRSIAVYRSTFGIVLDTSEYGVGQCGPDCPPTHAAIQKWIEDNHGDQRQQVKRHDGKRQMRGLETY